MSKVRAAYKKYHFVYKTTCLITKKYYFGIHSTNKLDDGYYGSGKILRYSIKKYGKENHVCEIFEMLPDRKSLILREAEIIDENKLKDTLCMNIIKGGNAYCEEIMEKVSKSLLGKTTWSKGKKLSDEHKRKISEALIGKQGFHHTYEAKQKISQAHLGKKLSDETKQKMSLSKIGFKMSEEQKEKLSRFRGENHSHYGTKLSEKTKQKISDAKKNWWKKNGKNFKHSEETKKKMAESQRKRRSRDLNGRQ